MGDTLTTQANNPNQSSKGTHIEGDVNTGSGDFTGRDKQVVVTSYNQSGGITAQTVNITAAPQPTVKAESIFANQSRNEEYHSRIALAVESPYPASNLFIAVHAPSIRRIELIPQRTGMVMMGHCGNREGMSFANLHHPFGLIHLDVFTGKPEPLKIEWDIQ